MKSSLYIHPDIRLAETLPAHFYRSEEWFSWTKEAVFARTWQWIGKHSLVPLEQSVFPFVFLEHFLEEPMLLVRQSNGEVMNLSNVCTHRGNLLVHSPGKKHKLICGYHGRRFGLDGTFEHMPEFSEAQNFPRPCDHLHRFPLKSWGDFLFTAIEPAFDLEKVLASMRERVGFLPLEQFHFDASRSKDYLVHAHWALYVENYLEGFHIPFVHQDLNQALDFGEYAYELGDWYNLQIGYGKPGESCFDLPAGHPDEGKNIAAWYYWLFPNMMFNFYPWGLSVNIVKPLAKDRTRVSFLTFVYDESKLDQGAGALLDKVEREDEFVVENVQRGMRSRVFSTGRYSPRHEVGIHQFHRLLARMGSSGEKRIAVDFAASHLS